MKEGELSAKWSKREKDFIVSYPSKPDGHLVNNHLFADILRYKFDPGNSSNFIVQNFIKELEARGYDPKTLKFSIQKKQQNI